MIQLLNLIYRLIEPSTSNDDFQGFKSKSKAKPEPLKGAIGEDTLYEDIPPDDLRFRFQYVNISSFPPSTHVVATTSPPTTIRHTTPARIIVNAAPPTTQLNNQNYVIDEEKMKSFWKKLNIPITAHIVEKREFPKDGIK